MNAARVAIGLFWLAMTGWLISDEPPVNFSIDQDTELRSTNETRAAVRYVRQTVELDEVRKHVEAGKQCTRLAMTWADRVSFVLSDGLDLKRVAPLDVLQEGRIPAADEAEQFSQAVFGVQGALGLEEADLVRIPRHQLTDSRVVLVPVARDPLPPVLRFILGKNPRPNGVMVPTRARRFCPMVRGQRVGPFQPPAKTLDHLFARPFQADNPNSRFQGNRILQVGQIERRHIADEVDVSRPAESREPLANHTFARLAFPRQKRRLLVRHLDSRLLVEHGGK